MTQPATILPHNQKPAATWNAGGEHYEDISRGIADAIEHAVFRLAPTPGERILDLATGTGWAARRVAAHGAQVTGLDLGEDLIQTARARARQERLEIDFVVGDAEALPFADGSFDAVISTFGIMFATRPEAAAAELARVTKRGGRVALTTWLPDSNVFKMFLVMKAFMPAPPSPAPPSPFAWGTRERVRELLAAAFDLRVENGTSFYREPSAERAWEAFSTGYGPTASLASNLDPNRRAHLARDFIAFHAHFGTELGICVPRDYLLTLGIRR